jgi:hypothetical protein
MELKKDNELFKVKFSTYENLNIKVKEPMSNTTKILIGVGVAGAVGLAVWYFGFRKKNGK